MPGRRTQRRSVPSKAVNGIIRPGVSFHESATVSGDQLQLQSSRFDSRSRSSLANNDNNNNNRKCKNIRRLQSHEEGVLYTVQVTESPSKKPSRCDTLSRRLFKSRGNPTTVKQEIQREVEEAGEDLPQASPSRTQQYTISKMRKHDHRWFAGTLRSFGIEMVEYEDVDSYLYKPCRPLAFYINWTFYASFSAVFLSFLAIFIVLCLVFAGLFALTGERTPECIVVSGEPYGTNPDTKFGDVFALSWTTFTTVGYGNVYPAVGVDYENTVATVRCSGVVFLCTLESFLGLIYAGMCAAILFGKVNRVQSHAHLTFANAVCLQYESVDGLNLFVDDDSTDSDCEDCFFNEGEEGEEENSGDDAKDSNGLDSPFTTSVKFSPEIVTKMKSRKETFMEQFKGCPVLKFQVVNDLCNKVGGEIIDGLMKVVGIKLKRREGKITHSQYVRVNLVDFEHPFFGRVWHGVHILDGDSPLLTETAKQKIRENDGSWPITWMDRPEKVRRKLDFQSLVVTVAGISNVSACTVHAYKRYKFEDIIVGFDFAPLVHENESSGKLEVDLDLVHDVREQCRGHGEDLKASASAEDDESSRSQTASDRTKHRVSLMGSDFTRGTSTLFKESTYTRPS